MDMTIEQLQTADKVVIGCWWFALVDGAMVAGGMTMGGKVMLDTADSLGAYTAHITRGLLRPTDDMGRFLDAARRAAWMLDAGSKVSSVPMVPVIDPDATLPRGVLTEQMRQDAAMLRGGRLTS